MPLLPVLDDARLDDALEGEGAVVDTGHLDQLDHSEATLAQWSNHLQVVQFRVGEEGIASLFVRSGVIVGGQHLHRVAMSLVERANETRERLPVQGVEGYRSLGVHIRRPPVLFHQRNLAKILAAPLFADFVLRTVFLVDRDPNRTVANNVKGVALRILFYYTISIMVIFLNIFHNSNYRIFEN